MRFAECKCQVLSRITLPVSRIQWFLPTAVGLVAGVEGAGPPTKIPAVSFGAELPVEVQNIGCPRVKCWLENGNVLCC